MNSEKNILIVCATDMEKQSIEKFLNSKDLKCKLSFLSTGVGMVATAFSLGQHLNNAQYDACINAGIAGAFDYNLKVGEVVEVKTDRFSEMGAEDDENFIDLIEMGMNWPSFYNTNGNIQIHHSFQHDLKKVKGITVNKVHGNNSSIEKIKSQFSPQIESMEGAAFFHAISALDLEGIQLRSISNYIQKRDKSQWNIPLALSSLSEEIYKILKTYED